MHFNVAQKICNACQRLLQMIFPPRLLCDGKVKQMFLLSRSFIKKYTGTVKNNGFRPCFSPLPLLVEGGEDAVEVGVDLVTHELEVLGLVAKLDFVAVDDDQVALVVGYPLLVALVQAL